MFIQTQPTPNPSSMMFLPGQTVMEVLHVSPFAVTLVVCPESHAHSLQVPQIQLEGSGHSRDRVG